MDKVYYYNRNNVLKITIGEDPYFMQLGSGEFKNNTWDYEEEFGRFRYFYRNKKTYPFSIVIKSNNDADFDALCDVFSEDVLAGEPGFFMINGWKLECFVTKAEHHFYGRRDNVIAFEAAAINSTWIRATTHSYNGVPGSGGAEIDLGRDYTYADDILGRGYNYGYSAAESHYGSIDLPGTDNGYEITIYGPQVNPVIYLNNQPVKVNITISSTERLRIVSNGSKRTIKVLTPSNAETDAFVYRDKEHSPFMKLGTHTDLTYGQIRFDLTTIERRSEPSWN